MFKHDDKYGAFMAVALPAVRIRAIIGAWWPNANRVA
jgi:hypothetical protein